MWIVPLGGAFCKSGGYTNTQIRPFVVKLGASRIVYTLPSSGGSSLVVYNKQNYPILIQSVILDAMRKKHGDLIVTPPLFRLDAGQQSRIRIEDIGYAFPTDRESLNWLCVKGIPPQNEDIWASSGGKSNLKDMNVDIQVSVNSCIKLLVRPSQIQEGVENAASSVVWTKEHGKLIANNPTPYYINISFVKLGILMPKNIDYIPPYKKYFFTFPEHIPENISTVTWGVVTDSGVEKTMQSALTH